MASNDNSDGLINYFSGDHGECDCKWARIEELLDKDNVDALNRAWTDFEHAMRRHLAMEEDVLFPAFESMSGMGQSGPTVVMRQEHEQMRALLDQIGFALHENDTEGAFDLGDTLHMLTQQHNIKEEGMLYPMAENLLGDAWTELRQQLSNY